jgi:hypothetical protein
MNWEGEAPAEPKRRRVANGETAVLRKVLLHCRKIQPLQSHSELITLHTTFEVRHFKRRNQPLTEVSGMSG